LGVGYGQEYGFSLAIATGSDIGSLGRPIPACRNHKENYVLSENSLTNAEYGDE